MKEGGFRERGVKAFEGSLPKITIVTAVYNGDLYLEQTLNSVLNQTYKNIELIVIDGGSTDNTLNILENYNDSIAYWISEPDKGIYDAWNKAIGLANGEWISFVGADDILLPNAVQLYVNKIKELNLSSLQYISAKVQLVKPDLDPIRIKGVPWSWSRFKVFMDIGHVGSLHHVSLFEKYGLYDTSYKIAADYELLLRAKDSLVTAFLDEVTVLMRTGGTSHANTRVFKETYKAKVHTAGRSKVASKSEYLIALTKFYLKKYLLK